MYYENTYWHEAWIMTNEIFLLYLLIIRLNFKRHDIMWHINNDIDRKFNTWDVICWNGKLQANDSSEHWTVNRKQSTLPLSSFSPNDEKLYSTHDSRLLLTIMRLGIDNKLALEMMCWTFLNMETLWLIRNMEQTL